MGKFSEEKKVGVRQEIESLDAQIERLKVALGKIDDEGAYTPMQQFIDANNDFMDQVVTWRNKKVSVTGEDQIERAAFEYDIDLQDAVHKFKLTVETMEEAERLRIDQAFEEIFMNAGDVPAFDPDVAAPRVLNGFSVPVMRDSFETLTEYTYTTQKNDFFGLLGAFGAPADEAKPVKVANYETWRSSAKNPSCH